MAFLAKLACLWCSSEIFIHVVSIITQFHSDPLASMCDLIFICLQLTWQGMEIGQRHITVYLCPWTVCVSWTPQVFSAFAFPYLIKIQNKHLKWNHCKFLNIFSKIWREKYIKLYKNHNFFEILFRNYMHYIVQEYITI